MKCPNCRCIVPNNEYECSYCGYIFSSGSSKTLTISEAYEDYMYYLYQDQPAAGSDYAENSYFRKTDFEKSEIEYSDCEGVFADKNSLLLLSAFEIIVLLLLQMFLLLL